MSNKILSVKKSETGSRLVAYKGGFVEIKSNDTVTGKDFKYLVLMFPEGRVALCPIVAKDLSEAYSIVKNRIHRLTVQA